MASKAIEELENGADLQNMMGIGAIENIIGILSIAVAVWLGLNIYEIYKKTDTEALAKKISRLEKDYESLKIASENKKKEVEMLMNTISHATERSKEYEREIVLRGLLNELEKTANKYEVSAYFVERFKDEKNIPLDYIEKLRELEKNFVHCCEVYERGQSAQCSQLCGELNKALKDYQKEWSEKISVVQILQDYFNIRIADMIYYRDLDDVDSINESIDLYEKVLKNIESKEFSNKRVLLGYMYNSMGLAYLTLIRKHSNNEESRSEWVEECKTNLEKAINQNDKGRYHQNLGSLYDSQGEYDEAYTEYKKAYASQYQDPKIHLLLGTGGLKIAEQMLGIDHRYTNKLLLTEIAEQKEIKEELSEARDYIRQACEYLHTAVGMPNIPDNVHYNYAKGCLYKYLFVDAENTDLLKECKLHLDIYSQLNQDINVGYFFTLRNYYEGIGNIEKAQNINEGIKDKQGAYIGDAETAAGVYAQRLQ